MRARLSAPRSSSRLRLAGLLGAAVCSAGLLGAAVLAPPADAGAAASPAASTQIKVLFDAAHAETAGNADWIISTSQPNPFGENSAPTRENDWTGALSSWGVALAQHRSSYYLDTLPAGRIFTYGDSSNSLDLSHYQVVVIDEPNTAFTSAERTALIRYVQNGGGLFLIVDHDQSDRNNDGVDSIDVAQQLFSSNGIDDSDPFGLTIAHDNISSENTTNLASGAGSHPVVQGAYGTASKSILRGATTFGIVKGDNSAARCLLYRAGVSNTGTNGCFIAVSGLGSGRIIVWGDSSPVDDGTGQSGNTLYDGWNDPAGTDAAWALNGTDWLGHLS